MSIKKIIKSIYYQPYIQNSFLKLISPVFPEPENYVDAELRYGVWKTTSNIFQVNGRQLGEANVHQGFRRRKFPIEYRECKIKGSRLGKQTNLTALQDIMRNYSDAMQILMLIREHYMETLSLDNQVFDAGTLFQFTQHVVSLPLFMNRDKSGNTNHSALIDLQITTLFQLVAGVFNLVRRLLEDKTEGVDIHSHVEAEQLYTFSEKNNLFTTPNADKRRKDKVCGGAKAKVIELLDVIINGKEAKNIFISNEDALTSRGVDANTYLSYSLTALQLETTINQCQLESIYKILSLKVFDGSKKLNSYSNEELSQIQLILDESELGSTLHDVFASSQRQKELQEVVHYRLSFTRNIIGEIHNSRSILDKSTQQYSLKRSAQDTNNTARLNQLKSLFDSQLADYKNAVIMLQKDILKILGDTRKMKPSHRFLDKKMSIIPIRYI